MRGLDILKQSIAPEKIPEPKGLQLMKNGLDSKKTIESNNIFEVGEQRKGHLDLTNRDYLSGYENPETIFQNEGGLDEVRANRQSWGVKAATGIGRAMVKAGAEVLKMPGVIGGAIAAPFAEEGQGWDTFVNNKWINTIDEYNEKINEDILPVYVKKAIKDGDLMDNLTSVDFWATEGADGAGFIASMFVPGALMKSFNIGSKFTEMASMSKKISNFQKMLGITPASIDNLAITTANTIFESASEAGSAMKSFEQDLNRKLNSGEIGEEEYNNLLKQKGELGRDMFLTNLAILAGPNMINTKLLYGVNKEAKQAAKYLTKDAEGKLIMNASKTLKGHLGDLGKGFVKALGREGFFEEGLQSTTENYFKKQASKGELTGNYLDNINLSDFGSEYLDMLSTVEGQKAIALGGILGSPLDFVHGIKQENRDRKETSKLLGILEHTNDAYLATTIKPDIWKRTEEIDPETGEHAFEIVNGKKVIDPVKRNEVIKKASNSEEFGKLFDIAQELNNTDALTMLQSIAEDNLITPMIMNSNLGMDVLTEHLKNNPSIPEESKKRILEKASVMQKAHNDFQNFSQPILKLDNKNADVNHKQAFYNLLNQSLLVNTSQQFQANKNLELIKRQITEVLASKGLTDDIASSVKNNYASTDIRLRKLYDSELENEEKIKKLKEEENTIWDSKEQKKAFDKYVEKSNDLRAKESPEKIEKATEKIDKINNAKTVKDVSDVLDENKKTEDVFIEDDSVKNNLENEFEQKLLQDQIIKKLNKSISDKDSTQLELNSLEDTVAYLEKLLGNTVTLSNKDVENIVAAINNYLTLHNSNSKKATKKGIQTAERISLLKNDIKNIYQLLNDIQDRIKQLEVQKEELEASKKYLDYKIEYYKKLLNKNLNFTELDNKISELKNKKSKLDKLINSLSKSIEKLLNLVKEIFNFISKSENELNAFKTKNDFKVLTQEELKDLILNNKSDAYATLKKNYDKQLENLNNLLDHAEINDALYDKKIKELNDLYSTIQKVSTQLDILEDLLNDDDLTSTPESINKEKNIVEEAKIEITKKHKRPPVNKFGNKKENIINDELDPQTEAVITKMGDDKIGEITAAQNEEITQGNDEVSQDVKDNKESILNDVREFNNVTVDGKEFIFINAFGLVVMNTMDNSISESFENIEQAVDYIENLLNKNVVEEVVKEESFEITPAIHTDQIEGDEILKNDEKNNEQADVKRKPTINTTGVDRKGNMLEWLPVKFKNWLVNLKNKKGTPVTFSLPEITKFSYDKKQMEAVKMLQSGDFTNKDFLYRHLPLQVDIDKDNFTFIATLQEDKVEEGTERYVARKNIVDAIINNSNKGEDKYKGITSTIDYQKGGELNYIQPKHVEDPLNSTLIELVENNISSLSEFNNNYKKVPLYFVKDEQGNVYDENKNDATSDFPSNLTSNQKGYVYTVITAHNGVKVPVKMNVKKLELQQAYLVYEVYKTLYLYNKENKVKLNQNNAKLTDLYSQNAQLKATIEKFFDKELSLFKNQSKITVADFMTVFIHDNLALDGTTKPYTTKYKGAGITFGQENFINFEKESSEFKDAFIDFLTTQKRQNVKLDFLGGTNNIDKNKYKDYLINNKVINVNLDTANPFKGDINVYVSSDIKSEKPNTITSINENIVKPIFEESNEAKKAELEKELFSETDNKGRTFTYFSTTTKKEGLIKIKFSFNRSDKDSSQRANAVMGIPIEKALGDKYTIDETYIPEGAKVVGVSEIRITKGGVGATVTFEVDGERYQGEVKLNSNTTYDAELKALEQPQQSDIEAKKAKIERRRQERRGDALEKIGVSRVGYDGKQRQDWKDAKNQDLKIATNHAIERLSKNPNVKIGSLPSSYSNAIKAELEIRGVNSNDKTPISEIIEKLREINAKYDAELKALEESTSNQSELEAKKAEINFINENAFVHGTDDGYRVGDTREHTRNYAKDIRQLVGSNGELGEKKNITQLSKDDKKIYNATIRLYDTNRGAGIGFLSVSVALPTNSIINEKEIYDILNDKLNQAVLQVTDTKSFLKTTNTNYKSISKIEFSKNNSQNTLISENKDVSLPPGSKGGRFSKKNDTPSKPDGFSKKDC